MPAMSPAPRASFRRLLALVSLVLLGRLAAQSIIVDNLDAGFTCTAPPTTSWAVGSSPTGFYGTNYRFDTTTTADAGLAAKWTPTIATAGYYHVYMRWVAFSNRPSAAPLEIAYQGGAHLDTTRTVNQQLNNGVWVFIGTYYLSTGTGNYVKIKGDGAGKTVADAVRFDLSYATITPPTYSPYSAAQNITGTGSQVSVIRDDNNKFSLRADGADLFVKGVCKPVHLDLMAEGGANCFRTYNAEDLIADPSILASAASNNLKVLVGLNLPHESASFTYWDNPDKWDNPDPNNPGYKQQFLAQVEQLKNEPTILGWAIGNEVDISTTKAPEAIYDALQSLARAVHQIDPFHPTVSVHAGPGNYDTASPTYFPKIQYIRQYAPDIDIVAVNSYKNVGTVDDKVTGSTNGGWIGAYLITEFSIDQPMEVPDTSLTYWKAIPEPTSDDKKDTLYYRYINIIPTATLRKQCLGTFVFATSDTFRISDTWYNLLLKNSSGDYAKTPGYDAMYHAWKGVTPSASAPTVTALTMNGTSSNVLLRLGQSVTAAVSTTGAPVKYTFEFRREVGIASDIAPTPIPVYSGTSSSPTFTVPSNAATDFGSYRLFCFVEDSTGRVGSANLPFRIFKSAGTIDTVSITTDPVDTMAKQGDNNVQLSAAATGSGSVSYQWYQLNYGRYHDFNYHALSGATSGTFTLNNVNSATDAGTYAVAVTDNNGTLLSKDVVLKILVPARISTQPANFTTPAGDIAVFTVVIDTATPKVTYPLAFQWRRNGVDLSTSNVPSANCRTLLLDPVQSADNGALYSVTITNSVSVSGTSKLSQTVISSGATLTVQP
jgi:hypothetical protein